MPAIKVVDRDTRSQRRRPKLWETFGIVGVNPTELKEGKGVFYAIVKEEQVETVINDEAKEVFLQNNFEVHTPIEYEAMHSIIIRHIDKAINEYTDEEVITSINSANEWAEVDSIHRIMTDGRLLKVKFKSTSMVQIALNQGIIVLHQKINTKHIEKEIFVRLTPCYNCYNYNHKTKDCPSERQVICSFCCEPGHKYNECTKENPKCINCGGRHRTLAAACKVRRELIKEKGKEIRMRSRSRSANRQTYASTTTGQTNRQPQIETQITQMNREQTKTIITKIMASIVYAHYMETIQTGTFQNTIDEMFDLNNLPRVKFPTKIITEGIKDLFNNATPTNYTTENEPATQRQEHPHKKQEVQIVAEAMEIESNRRQRESNQFSPMENIEKKKKETEKTVVTETPTQMTDSNLSLPPPLQSRPAPAVPRPSGTATSENVEKKKASQNKPKLSVKEIGIMVYFKRSSKYVIDTSNLEKREILRDAILRGEAKIQWRHTNVAYEAIYNGITNRFIKLEEVTISKLPDNDFNKLKNKCINL